MEQDSTVSRQISCFLLSISLVILLSSRGIFSSVGLAARTRSLSAIMFLASCVRPGVKLGTLPRGMLRLDTFWRILRKTFSPASHEDGGGAALKASSVSVVKVGQLAFLKLVKEVGPGGGGSANQPSRSTRMGRWSEFRVVIGCQLEFRPMCALVMVRSGEEGGPLEGILVGQSWLMTIRVELARASTILVPLSAAAASEVEEYQRSSWALKSPMTRVSSVELKRESKSGRYPDGQEEDGGI